MVRTESSRPHRDDRVFGHIASLRCCCFSRQTHHWAALFCFTKQPSQSPFSICESSACQLKQQTKDCAPFIGWAQGLSFIFNKTVLCDYLSKHRQRISEASAFVFIIWKLGSSKRNICFMQSRIKAKFPSLNTIYVSRWRLLWASCNAVIMITRYLLNYYDKRYHLNSFLNLRIKG